MAYRKRDDPSEEEKKFQCEALSKLERIKELEKQILCFLESIKKKIKEDIDIDKKILNVVNQISTLLQFINATINNINTIVQDLAASINTILTLLNSIVDSLANLAILINNINNNVTTILGLVQNINANINILIALACRPISAVPFVITEPGCYKVVNELVFAGAGAAAAIDILVNDVILDGGNFTITITGPNNVGVRSLNRENITIRNLNVTSGNPDPAVNVANRGLLINGNNNVYIERVHTQFTNRGINFGVGSNIWIVDSLFDRHTSPLRVTAGIALLGQISNIQIRNSKFYKTNSIEDLGRGIAIQPLGGLVAGVDNVQIIDTQFSDSLIFAASFLTNLGITNLEIRGCQFSVTDPAYQGWSVLVVSEVGNIVIRGVTIRDCQFANPESSSFYEPITFIGVSGFIIEGCNIVANSAGNNIERGVINTGLIHLGYTITTVLEGSGIPDAQVENGTVKNCTLAGGTSLQNSHQNTGILIEAFTNNVTIDEVNIYQTGVGNVAPPLLTQLKERKNHKIMMIDGEEEEIRRDKNIPNRNIAKVNKILSKAKMPLNNKLKVPPPIPDQLAAGILVQGGFNIYIKDSVISDAGAGTPGTLPGNGITLTGILEFQSVPGASDPPLTITTPPTTGVKIWKTIVSSNQGNGIEDDGVLNDIKENNIKNNELAGILLTGISAFVEGNNVFSNFGNGIVNTGLANAILNNVAARNLPTDYVGVPAVVPQGAPCVAGQNVQAV